MDSLNRTNHIGWREYNFFLCLMFFFVHIFLSFLWQREFYEREMEKRVICRNPLGKDRFYNRYLWFPRDGRIFIESSDSKEWAYYSSKEEVLMLLSYLIFILFFSLSLSLYLGNYIHILDQLDALMGSLNIKGEREWALRKQLEKFYGKIWSVLDFFLNNKWSLRIPSNFIFVNLHFLFPSLLKITLFLFCYSLLHKL